MTDEKLTTLVGSAVAGDKAAFQALMEACERRVLATAYSYVHNLQHAEDVSQEVFLRAYLDLPKLKEPAKFASWLVGIASHVAVDWLRKRKAAGVSLDDGAQAALADPAAADPSAPAAAAEVRVRVERAVAELPEQTRRCVCMRYFEDLSYAEIAEALDVPHSTVRGALYRGAKKLREELLDLLQETQ